MDIKVTPGLQKVLNKNDTATRSISLSGASAHFQTSGGRFCSVNNQYCTLQGVSTRYVRTGYGTSTKPLTSPNDFYFSGKIDVGGTAYFQRSINLNGGYAFEVSSAGGFKWMPDDGWHWYIAQTEGAANNNMIITTYANFDKDHGHNTTHADPWLIFHSGSSVDVTTTEWIGYYFSSADGFARIKTGQGPLAIDTSILYNSKAIDHTDSPYTTEDQYTEFGVDTTTDVVEVVLASALIPSDATKILELVVVDEGGNAGTKNITISTEGAETINGLASVTISADYGSARLRIRGGASNWVLI